MPNRKNAKQGADALKAAENRERAILLRIEGQSFRQIAAALGVSHTTARGYVQSSFDERAAAVQESTELLRDQENERLDAIQEAMWRERRDPKRATVLIAISRQRAAINGLNRPTEIKIEGDLAAKVDVSKLSPEQAEQLDALLEAAGIE